MTQSSAHAPVWYFVYFLGAAWVCMPASCKQALAEVAYSLMKGEQG